MGGPKPGSLLPRPGETPVSGDDRGLTEVTTSSIEAYRYYAEGMNYHERGLSSEAAPLLEKAIEIDPDFAMAYAKLAVVNNNLALFDKRDEYAKRALERTERLTSRERYYIEGFYYGAAAGNPRAKPGRPTSRGWRSIPSTRRRGITLASNSSCSSDFPKRSSSTEELIRRGTSSPTAYENLSEALLDTGNIRRALEVSEKFVAQYPENAAGLRMMGNVLIADGRLDAARSALEKSQALDPLDFGPRLGRRTVAILQDRWAEAETVNEEFGKARGPFNQFLSLSGAGVLAAAHGRGQAMFDFWDRAARVPGLSAPQRAATRNRLSRMLLRQGKSSAALAQAELALVDARNRDQEFETLQVLAIAQAAVGRKADADKTLAQLESRAKIIPSDRETRRVHWARGEIALLSGDTSTAVAELTKAQQMLPAHGPPLGPPSNHGDLWFAAASAALKAGRDPEAATLLERLQSGHERVFALEAYGRSFFLLGQIYERRGDDVRAREQYARFLDLWRGGDLERGWVAEAEKKVVRGLTRVETEATEERNDFENAARLDRPLRAGLRGSRSHRGEVACGRARRQAVRQRRPVRKTLGHDLLRRRPTEQRQSDHHRHRQGADKRRRESRVLFRFLPDQAQGRDEGQRHAAL